jgi:hypothetical protein
MVRNFLFTSILCIASLALLADETDALKQKQLEAVKAAILEIKTLNAGQASPTGSLGTVVQTPAGKALLSPNEFAIVNYSLMFAVCVLLAGLAALWLKRRYAVQRRKNLCVRLATATTALPETSNSRAAAVAEYFRKKNAAGPL